MLEVVRVHPLIEFVGVRQIDLGQIDPVDVGKPPQKRMQVLVGIEPDPDLVLVLSDPHDGKIRDHNRICERGENNLITQVLPVVADLPFPAAGGIPELEDVGAEFGAHGTLPHRSACLYSMATALTDRLLTVPETETPRTLP